MEPKASRIQFLLETEMRYMRVCLQSGGYILVTINGIQELASASESQLRNYELIGDGRGISWPELDEDLSVMGLYKDFPFIGGEDQKQ